MLASEFFLEVEQCLKLGCTKIAVDANDVKITRVMYNGCVLDNLESLLVLKDIYSPNVYMYARFVRLSSSHKEMEIIDSDARSLGDLRIEGVFVNDDEMIIEARIVGSD